MFIFPPYQESNLSIFRLCISPTPTEKNRRETKQKSVEAIYANNYQQKACKLVREMCSFALKRRGSLAIMKLFISRMKHWGDDNETGERICRFCCSENVLICLLRREVFIIELKVAWCFRSFFGRVLCLSPAERLFDFMSHGLPPCRWLVQWHS